MMIVSPNKGYLFSYLTQSMIVFDPESMVLVRDVPVDFNLPRIRLSHFLGGSRTGSNRSNAILGACLGRLRRVESF